MKRVVPLGFLSSRLEVGCLEVLILVLRGGFFFFLSSFFFFEGGVVVMSAREISQLCENLSLADEDEVVREVAEEDIQDGTEDVDKCLVGKVLSGKKVNREAFKGLIEQIWSPCGQVEIELVGENISMFYFINKEDRN